MTTGTGPAAPTPHSSLPLRGMRVVELAMAAPGPYCGLLLSQLGAEVVKVEPPSGDYLRVMPSYFAAFNANKRSIALDLKRDEQRAVFAELARRADVMIEGFRPGVAARLGVEYERLTADNPGLVYVSISGFGQDGPYRERAGHDLNYLAVGGILGLQEQLVGHTEPPPVLISDLASGLFAAFGVCAALAERARTDRGRYLDLSMADTAANWLGLALAWQALGAVGAPNATYLPHYGVFRAADGRAVTLGIVREQHFWTAFCERVGLDELCGLDHRAREARADEIRARLERVFATRPAAEWEALLAGAEVPFAVVRPLAEVPDDPQLRARGLFETVTGNDGATFPLPGLPFLLAGRQPARRPPELDEDGAAIRAELAE